ncbi:exocyst complex component 3-like protein 2 [Callorhinchus milii]|uniref:exocyst complex component 3-like protein 2 n=1 Tax=Callorhinchus milii TaxID=7868 RepID=UPI001C3FBE79|nr:exocyst complex component 3-like protein 2 [Callorhinchus milii]
MSNHLGLLKKAENKSCDKLLEELFYKITVQLKNYLKSNEWFTERYIDSVLESLTSYFKLRPEKDQGINQALVDRAHVRTIQESIKALYRNSKCSDDNRIILAGRMKKDSDRLKTYFVQKSSTVTWINDVILLLAEIIEIDDPESLKVVIADLILKYPDVSKKHIYALLNIRGNVSKSCLRGTIKDAIKNNNGRSSCNNLFDGIKVKSSCTIL